MINVEVVPRNLVVSIYRHEVISFGGPVPCWSYLTDGLRKTGQKELVLTVSRGPNDETPSEHPLQFFAQIWQLASNGELVDAGGFTNLFTSGFLGPFTGVIYGRAQRLSGIPAGDDTLAVILVTEDELEVARLCGTSRVLTRLGFEYRHFPFPPWSDRGRNSVVTLASWMESMLTKLPLPWLSPTGTRVRQQGGGLRFSLYTPAVTFINDFLSRLEPAQSVVFHAEPDPEADAMLVWEPGRRQPTAISAEGASGDPVAGCFVAFVPAGKNEITLVEDGFLMAFTAESWDEVRGAMQLGLPASVPGPSGLPIFELSWWPPAPKADRTPN